MSKFHARLLELESEIIAKEQAARGLKEVPLECGLLLESIEKDIGLRLGDEAPSDWRGWLTFRRTKEQVDRRLDINLIICRGRTFKESGLFGKHRAGLDVSYGLDSVTEYRRGFDVSPPQDLDHLLINFGSGESVKVFLWYGENIAPYRLIFEAEIQDEPHENMSEAVVEACIWIATKPKDMTLPEFLEKQKDNLQ